MDNKIETNKVEWNSSIVYWYNRMYNRYTADELKNIKSSTEVYNACYIGGMPEEDGAAIETALKHLLKYYNIS
jgi:hypothetical protein